MTGVSFSSLGNSAKFGVVLGTASGMGEEGRDNGVGATRGELSDESVEYPECSDRKAESLVSALVELRSSRLSGLRVFVVSVGVAVMAGPGGKLRRSSFDILICCSTTVSFSSIRCVYPNDIPISTAYQTKFRTYL